MDFSDLRGDADTLPWTDRPGHVILEGIVGSRAYGLQHEQSDTDKLGIYLAPSGDFFGLEPVIETARNPWTDEVLHEAGKFCRLALKVNPAVIELLWLDEHIICTAAGAELLALRSSFLSAGRCRDAYLGYARSQFGKLRDRGDGTFSSDLRGRTAKHARHLARLLHAGFDLWSTGDLQVAVSNPQWFIDFGERVAAGDQVAAERLIDEYEQLFAKHPSVLADAPDQPLIEDWLRTVRTRTLAAA